MGKNVVSKGKTVKEAVTLALELLSVHKNEVDIEVIENETKGLFGLGSKPAVVRVTVKEREADSRTRVRETPSMEDLEQAVKALDSHTEPNRSTYESKQESASDEDLGGKVWIQDGHIFCMDAPDKYPLVSPGNGVKLYKNDELVEKKFVVREEDILTVELEDEVHEPSWGITLSDDKMEAILRVTPGFSIHRRLKNKPPSHFVQLEVIESKVAAILDTGPVMEMLKELGVVHGLDYTEIARACTCEEPGSFTIAKGTPPVPGTHGYFESIMEIDVKKRLKERTDGTIDYRETQEFPSVEQGQIIGIVHSPQQGIPGRAVTNELVAPPEALPLTVKEGRGVVLVENGKKVVAVDSGHPEIQTKGQLMLISVAPKLLIGKDVDLQTGNVHYLGDIEVIGNVQDGMLVEAQGNIMVRSNVHAAKVLAGSSVIVQKNIIASEITAGKGSFLQAELSQLLTETIEQMRQIVLAIQQLSSVSAFKINSFTRTGLGPLLKILCEGKFKGFPALKTALLDKIRSGEKELGEEWRQFFERLDKGFHPLHPSNLQSEEELYRLITAAEQLLDSIQETDEAHNRFIKAGFAHNSQLYSSGDISLAGQGIYNSKLYAKGYIEVLGFVRGGDIYAEKGVSIGEAGTKGGGFTKISVSQQGTIRIKHVLEDTIIQVGTRMHKFAYPSSLVYARLNEAGELILTT